VSTLGSAARRWLTDASLYGLSAGFAAVTAFAADIPLQRMWGRTALWGYSVATVGAVAASFRRWNETQERRCRVLLAISVFVATALAPLAAATYLRAQGDPGDHAQSEVIIVEEGADALFDGRDPYSEGYLGGPLSDRPLATQIHFPYLPLMLAFGVPRALVGHAPWADARVWFTIVSVSIAIASLRQMRTSPYARVRTFQVLLALPTGALLLATGGGDIPVLALLLAASVLAQRGDAMGAGLVGGSALAMKQTSLLVLPFIALAMPAGSDRRRYLATAGLVGLVLSVPFAVWDFGAFVEDTILFPLNAGQGESAAGTPTIGSLLLDLFPSQRSAITVILVSVVLAAVAYLLFSGRGASMSDACMRAAGAFLIAFALAPAARVGYLVYPVNLVTWAFAFRQEDADADSSLEATGTAPLSNVRET
jgi:hypothetical protein